MSTNVRSSMYKSFNIFENLVVMAEQADCHDCHNEVHLNWMTHLSLVTCTLVNVYVDLVVFTRIAGTS